VKSKNLKKFFYVAPRFGQPEFYVSLFKLNAEARGDAHPPSASADFPVSSVEIRQDYTKVTRVFFRYFQGQLRTDSLE